MAEPTRRNPKLIEGVLFPVRYIWQQQCFEQSDFEKVSCERVAQIVNKLAGKVRRADRRTDG